MLRAIDLFLSTLGLVLFFPLLLLIFIVGIFDTGKPLLLQMRVGRHQRPFVLIKFRTMKVGAAVVPSHLASSDSITKFGRLLRVSKIDELPQLWNVLCGEMSLVGPRPCLSSQVELIRERENRGVFAVRPGITGLAQIKKIDMSTPRQLAETDAHMISTFNFKNYFLYIFKTVLGGGAGDRVGAK
jgi:lipopolysaccharide/colanic/teichoic acid biosynthesis glycosyltransferase